MAEASDFDLAAFLKPLDVDDTRLLLLARRFSSTYRHLAQTSTEQFLPTPITALPSGQETGKFLAIDVGGSNLRVGFIELLGQGPTSALPPSDGRARDQTSEQFRLRRTHEKAWPIGDHLKMDKAEDLFAWIGDCISEVVEDDVESSPTSGLGLDSGGSHDEVVMGITFSFPMIQTSLAEATLMPMGKGFAITSNLNLGKLLLAGYERHTVAVLPETDSLKSSDRPTLKRRKVRKLPHLRIAAISNDTVATLAAMSYAVQSQSQGKVAMGLIVGTGTNATIPMRLADLSETKRNSVLLPEGITRESAEVVVNTEWTISGTAPPLRDLGFVTIWDEILDRTSEAPGFQPFEYMTAGRYLGELARLCVLDIFTNQFRVSEKYLPLGLRQRNALTTTFLAKVAASAGSTTSLLDELQEELPPPSGSSWAWDVESSEILRKVASKLQVRSAGLIAAAVIGLLGCTRHIDLADEENTERSKISNADGQTTPKELVVACTGGVISNYPGFLESCQSRIDELLSLEGPRNAKKHILLQEALDGGIIGAGVLAGTVANMS